MSDGPFFTQAPLSGRNISFTESILKYNHVIEADVVGKTLEYNMLHTGLIALSKR